MKYLTLNYKPFENRGKDSKICAYLFFFTKNIFAHGLKPTLMVKNSSICITFAIYKIA